MPTPHGVDTKTQLAMAEDMGVVARPSVHHPSRGPVTVSMPKLREFFLRPASATPLPIAAPDAISRPSLTAAPPPVATDTETPVLDCLGAVLQCWARYPIQLPDEDRTDAERVILEWQRHATIGTPIPGVHAPDAVSGPVHARDWKSLTSLTSERRRAEAANAGQQLGDLQRVVWDTVTSLVRVAGDDAVTDSAVEQQLALLRACARRGDPAAVMRELPEALRLITEAITARQTRAAQERSLMAERVESLGRALSSAEDSARTDPLSGAGNRLRFTEATERAMALMTLSGAVASLITLDLDGLKVINDTLGHPAGDLAIRAVVKSCWIVCTRATDVVCRIGGDEFAIVMLNTDARAAAALADRLEHRLNETLVPLADGVTRTVTASLGVSTAKHGETVEQWIARADQRLYEAKRSRAT